MAFVKSKANHSLFFKITFKFTIYLLAYVDDIILTSSDFEKFKQLNSMLNAKLL